MRSDAPGGAVVPAAIGGKGLKQDAISFVSNVAIGIASTAPAYSLAATLGLVAGFANVSTPAVMIVAFVPMLCIAVACNFLNRADPDCGTTFAWVTRAMGPHMGWMGGWGVIATNVIVMPSLADIAARYSFRLIGIAEPSLLALAATGAVWIALMTAICYFGIELSARTQRWLLAVELLLLAAFAIVALVKVYAGGAPAGALHVSPDWFNPFATNGLDNFTQAILLAVFIYWGWDTGVAVNEETRNPRVVPGRAAVVSTFLLLAVYAAVAVAAVAFAGPAVLAEDSNDVLAALGSSVLGPQLAILLTFAVLTSAIASAQTTILPTARIAVSMAYAGAIPRRFADIHPRYRIPGFATLAMGGVSIAWFVVLTAFSRNVIADSALALGLIIAFYYGLTGIACVVFFRREVFATLSNFLFIGALPALGGLMMLALFIRACFAFGKQSAGSTVIFGIGGPLVMGIGALAIGVVVMAAAQRRLPDFFRRRPEVAEPVAVSLRLPPPPWHGR